MDTSQEVKKAASGLRRVGYTAAGAALGSVTGRIVGMMLLGPLGYRVGQVAGGVAGGALGFQLSGDAAEGGARPADREPAVVKADEPGGEVVDAVF